MEQVQIRYQPEQDRLLFAIKDNGQVFKLWLTRRFVMLFLAQLSQVVRNDPVVAAQAKPDAQQQVMQFQKEGANANGKVKKSVNELKIEEDESQPLLATAVSIDKQVLVIHCLEKKNLTIKFNTNLAYGIISLIEASLKKTGWGFTGVREVNKPKESANTPIQPNYSFSIN